MVTVVPPSLLTVVVIGALAFAGYLLVVTALGWMPLVRPGRPPGLTAGAQRHVLAGTDTASVERRLRPVAAVIPAWNAADRICAVLAAAKPQLDLVVVVDNGSTDGTADQAASLYPDIAVIRRAVNDGYAVALNEGMARALALGAGSALWLNDDVILEDGAVECLVGLLMSQHDAAAASARLVYQDRPEVLNGAGGSWRPDRSWAALRGEGEADLGQYDQAPDPDYPSGAASLVAVDAWINVGPMDETWYLYYEDVDWGLRAGRGGWRTAYAPGALARHAGSLGTRTDPARRRYYNVRNRLRFAARYASPAGRVWVWAATSLLLAKQGLRLFFPTRRRDAEAVVLAVGDHIRGRTGRSPRFD
jgi:GT2 family glycosyltransferase